MFELIHSHLCLLLLFLRGLLRDFDPVIFPHLLFCCMENKPTRAPFIPCASDYINRRWHDHMASVSTFYKCHAPSTSEMTPAIIACRCVINLHNDFWELGQKARWSNLSCFTLFPLFALAADQRVSLLVYSVSMNDLWMHYLMPFGTECKYKIHDWQEN